MHEVATLEKGITLTFLEIKLLLYGMGICRVEGICMPNTPVSEEAVAESMHHLAGAGFILVREDKFTIAEDVREALTVMAYPEETFTWERGDFAPSYFIYRRGDKILVSEKPPQKEEALRLTLFSLEAYERWREEAAT